VELTIAQAQLVGLLMTNCYERLACQRQGGLHRALEKIKRESQRDAPMVELLKAPITVFNGLINRLIAEEFSQLADLRHWKWI
jgi:hypothetical protein